MTRNRSNNKVPQVRPRCVFCDVEGVTNEHLWPLWMHPLLPEDLKDFHISYVTSTNFVDGEKVSEKEKREHRGAVRHTKIRRFCKRCNETWMGSIEREAMGILEDMMLSKKMRLSENNVTKVATWFALKSMVFEYTGHPDSIAVPKSDYDYIRANKLPPPHWRIWIGSQNVDSWIMRCFNQPTVGAMLSDIKSNIAKVDGCNVQATSFGLLQLFAHISSSDDPRLVKQHDTAIDNRRAENGEHGLLTIWPFSGEIEWPRTFFLGSDDLEYFANSVALNSIAPPKGLALPSFHKVSS